MRFILALLAVVALILEVCSLPAAFFQFFSSARAAKKRGNGSQGEQRYKDICQLHNVDSLTFPGALGNPICPY